MKNLAERSITFDTEPMTMTDDTTRNFTVVGEAALADPPAAAEPTAAAPPRTEDPAIDALAADIASVPLKKTMLRALARTIVALAAEAGGHDPRHVRPADVLTADNIEGLVLDVMAAPAVELPAAFRAHSDVADLIRQIEIAKAAAKK